MKIAALQMVSGLQPEANLAQAQANLARNEPLAAAKAISQTEWIGYQTALKQAQADVATAKAAVTTARLNVDYAQVRAPISGTIGRALVTEGALVGTTDLSPMARVQQIDQVYVDVRQPASMLETLRKSAGRPSAADSRAAILDAQGKPYPVKGEILFSGINVDAGTGDVGVSSTSTSANAFRKSWRMSVRTFCAEP